MNSFPCIFDRDSGSVSQGFCVDTVYIIIVQGKMYLLLREDLNENFLFDQSKIFVTMIPT